MKKWLKNSKGLTLVELLAVIVILGIIAAIAVPTISGSIKNAKVRADFATYDMIKDAAIRWALDQQVRGEPGSTPIGNSPTVASLQKDGYLTEYDEKAQSNSAITFSFYKVVVDATTGVMTVTIHDINKKTINKQELTNTLTAT